MKYRADIDGLRATAVISVFLYHLNISLFQGGFIGVDIFFVISGYVITKQLLQLEQAGTFSYLEFLQRRIKRLWPAVYFLLVCTSIFAIFTLYPSDYRKFFSAAIKVLLLIPNFYFAKNINYFEPANETSPLLHTWSLGVEEQLYFFYPLILIYGLRRFGIITTTYLLILISLLSLGYSEYLVVQQDSKAFYMVYTRAWEFIIGGVLAFKYFPQISSKVVNTLLAYLGSLMLISSVFMLDSGIQFPGLNAIYPCVGTALIIYAGTNVNTLIHKILTIKPLVFTGVISYSLYLWHWPIIAFYFLITTNMPNNFVCVLIILATYGVAYFSWRFIEQPFRNNKQESKLASLTHSTVKPYIFNQYSVLRNAVISVILFTAISQLLANQYKATWRIYQPAAIAESVNEVNITKFITEPTHYQGILLGDSHAAAYYYAVKVWAKKHHVTVKLFAEPNCPGIFGDFTLNKKAKEIKSCQDHNAQALELVKNNKELKFVILASRHEHYTENKILAEHYQQALVSTIEELQKLGLKIVILGQVPLFKNPPHYATFWSKFFDTTSGAFSFSKIDSNFINTKLSFSIKLTQYLASTYQFDYFDPLPYMKSAEYQGKSLYFDDNHLNIIGSEYLAQFISLPNLEAFIAKQDRTNSIG